MDGIYYRFIAIPLFAIPIPGAFSFTSPAPLFFSHDTEGTETSVKNERKDLSDQITMLFPSQDKFEAAHIHNFVCSKRTSKHHHAPVSSTSSCTSLTVEQKRSLQTHAMKPLPVSMIVCLLCKAYAAASYPSAHNVFDPPLPNEQ